jgi:hypothetical protein
MLNLPPLLFFDLRRLLYRLKRKQRIWLYQRSDGTYEVL